MNAEKIVKPTLLTGGAAPDPGVKRLRRQQFARRLEHLLMQKAWRQVDLSRASGIGRDSISTYLKGKTVPSRLSLQKMAKVFQIEPDQLYPNYAADAVAEEYKANVPAISSLPLIQLIPAAFVESICVTCI